MLVHAVRVLRVGAAVLKGDGAGDDGFGAQPGEHERQHRPDGARQQAGPDQAFFHAAAPVSGREAEQVPGVVHEFVHVRVAAEQRHRPWSTPTR